MPVAAVSKIVDEVFRSNYGLGEYQGVPRTDSDRVDHEQQGASLEEAIYHLTQATEDEVARVLVRQLIEDDAYWPPDGEEPFYASDQNYVRYHGGEFGHSELWRDLVLENVDFRRRSIGGWTIRRTFATLKRSISPL